MKAIHLTAYGNPAQDLRLVEVSEPDTPPTGVAGGECLCSSPYSVRIDRIAHETP
jgi:hypothetical protein